jgi:pimeloyl-ACP methyl ester carboxylesterase
MKTLSSAKKIVSDDGLDIYYWVNWRKDLQKNFVILHPGSSMNHTSLQILEQGLNKRGFPTIVLDPRGFGYSKAPAQRRYFTLEKYSNDLQKIIEKESVKKPLFVTHSFGFMPVVDYVAKTSNADKIVGICASHNFHQTANSKLLFHLFNRVLRYSEYAGSIGKKFIHFLRKDKRGYTDYSQMDGKNDIDVWFSLVDVPFKEIKTHIVSGKEINRWDITEQIKNIKTQLLLIYGNKDSMVKAKAGDYIQSLSLGKTYIEVLPGTHSLPIIQPNSILKIIDKYY